MCPTHHVAILGRLYRAASEGGDQEAGVNGQGGLGLFLGVCVTAFLELGAAPVYARIWAAEAMVEVPARSGGSCRDGGHRLLWLISARDKWNTIQIRALS